VVNNAAYDIVMALASVVKNLDLGQTLGPTQPILDEGTYIYIYVCMCILTFVFQVLHPCCLVLAVITKGTLRFYGA
jgi:hypothetical protein